MAFTFRQRIISHFDSLILQPTDQPRVMVKMRSRNMAVLSFLMPTVKLQERVHGRFEVETMAVDADGKPYGILTAVVSEFSVVESLRRTFFEKVLEDPWIGQLALKTSVVDRMNWDRTSWHFTSFLRSKHWGEFPRTAYGVDMRPHKVTVKAEYAAAGGPQQTAAAAAAGAGGIAARCTSYVAECPDIGFRLRLEDTGVGLLDRDVRTTDGFVDNESALRVIGMGRETVSRGNEGVCFRTGLWSTPVVPNLARIVEFTPGRRVCDLFDVTEDEFPSKAPIAVWLAHEIPETFVYQTESQIEGENEPNDYTDQNDQTFADRAQRRSMNRTMDLQDEIRRKSYKQFGNVKVFGAPQ
jgi:hypothetical protein